MRPPRVRTITFLPCNCCIYWMELVQYRTLFCCANSSIPSQPCIQFLLVSLGFCVRLPSDSISRWTPLSFANSSYCKACSGLSPPSYSPCWAHKKETLLLHNISFISPFPLAESWRRTYSFLIISSIFRTIEIQSNQRFHFKCL